MKIKRLLYRVWHFEESHNAAIWFVLGLVAALRFHALFFECANYYDWERQTIYSSAFDFGGIYTAFLFAFYTYSISSGSDFFVKARNTKIFKRMIVFVKKAIVLGFILTLASIPMMIWNPSPDRTFNTDSLIVCLWFALACASLASFWQATRLFWVFAKTAE
ncbi:hypothetical protein [Hyphomonas jannaschiana]|uniref:Uncharacterized protein n=1 Tax=Hyphomonas jannaschiana VP2 TaxID=1280952 RepID=A0A059FKX3_9PROT|nr:hypothetical protein [Hyphomonas jannaschiana]KCZ91315.1 hypothetical protein HJA_02215 [Hyphomonas jannaschiana VP2]